MGEECDQALKELADKLTATEADFEYPIGFLVQEIENELVERSKYNIMKIQVGGSVAKGTAIRFDFDVDLFVYIRDVEPPFHEIIEEFQEIILSLDCCPDVTMARCIDGMVFKAYISGIAFDIVPGVFFSDNLQEQRICSLKRIKELPNEADSSRWNSSLEESRVQFVTETSDFVRNAVRVAKYWNKTLALSSRYIAGRTMLVECIAIYHAKQEEVKSGSNPSIFRAFRCFLEAFRRFHNINVVFDSFYGSDVIPFDLRYPVVLDPCNPHINLVLAVTQNSIVWDEFKEFAKITMKRLSQARWNWEIPNKIEYIFDPQPDTPPSFLLKRSSLPQDPQKWLIDVGKPVVRGDNSKIIVTNSHLFNKYGLLIMQIYLCNNVKIVCNNDASTCQLRQQVWDIINVNIFGNPTSSVDCTLEPQSDIDYHVTFYVPLDVHFIKVSLNWSA